MVDTCANCFYKRTDGNSVDRCHVSRPRPVEAQFPGRTDAILYPRLPDPPWCGEGADNATGRSFSSTINAVPGTGGDGRGYLATSTTSLTIASSGSLAPITQLNLAYSAGARVRLTSTGSAAWMEGVVTGYAADGTLTFTADLSSGSGSHTDWNINLAGAAGAATTGIASQGGIVCAATRPITVPDVAVQAGSKIFLMASNADASKLMRGDTVGGKGVFVSSRSPGVSFDIDTDDSGSFAGTELFDYIIVNP